MKSNSAKQQHQVSKKKCEERMMGDNESNFGAPF
jgi:hypothetical protein